MHSESGGEHAARSSTEPETARVTSPDDVAAPAKVTPPHADGESPIDESRLLGADLPQSSFPSPAAAQLSAGVLRENQLFGKYRVVRDLGAGGMAQVFLASIDGPEGFQKQCVVKKILPEYARDPNFSKMFINEARIAAMMSHQNIVQVYEFSRENDEFFLSMEYVSGASLDRIMRTARKVNQPLGPRVAVEVGIGMAHALSYAHTFTTPEGLPLDIVHRDVSPENILVSREGAVKLTDFGVVKSAMSGQNTVAGVVKGKWSYMSPEQVSSRPLDGRSDVFSLGIVLYEVSVGRRLFRGESLPATVNAVMLAQVTPPSALVPNFPAQLERILMTALNRDPAQRYRTAHDFAVALEQFRASQPWTSGGRHLASVVNTLFPRDGSQPGVNLTPGSGASEGVALAPAQEDDLPSLSDGITIDVQAPVSASLSPALLLTLGATLVLGSALFWYLLS
ncbi:MAG: serine/threonine-protein kinase [Archangium sp.]|nr:serine/threonine-protein kinase [Archangium sp.]MDP3157078.1 serine/threonine-protein kinase [Archangium sp.]MDP3575795.1 serine/threonine-protein kinase [Archangium sp.]